VRLTYAHVALHCGASHALCRKHPRSVQRHDVMANLAFHPLGVDK